MGLGFMSPGGEYSLFFSTFDPKQIIMKPRKSLSQNYLTDPNIARKIAGSVTHDDAGRIIEIGPGYGMLSQYLLERFGRKLSLIEIDNDAVEHLKNEFPAISDNILKADILEFPLEDILHPVTVLVGNLPYHITSPILFRLLEVRQNIVEAVFMVQKEVAERIVAPPGNRQYGILSVLLSTFYQTQYLFTVSPNVFFPKPKVQSAVFRLSKNERPPLPFEFMWYKELIKKVFGTRRKMLRNSLGPLAEKVSVHRRFLTMRPEQLSVEDFIALAEEIAGD